MYQTVLKLIWPYILRKLASFVADQLENRRQERNAPKEQADERPPECPPCPPCPPAEERAAAPEKTSTANLVWFSLSGVMLSAALGLIGYLIVRNQQ